MLRWLIASSLVFATLGCDEPEPMCTGDDDCSSGAVCVMGECRLAMTDSGPRVDSGPTPVDSGPGVDAGPGDPPPPRPVARWPMNGASTGSIHGSVVLPEPALTPLFAWDASTGADRYELQITDECTTPGFADCAFAAPVVDESVSGASHRTGVLPVSTTAPVGRRYYWRVRACAATCSAYSPVRYVDVGRQPNDFNGDGYADVLGGAHNHASGVGRAYWWAGTSTGPGARARLASPTAEATGYFGLELAALGDVNADGYADAIIGAYARDAGGTDTGEAYIYLGSDMGLVETPDTTLAPLAEDSAQFARSVAPAGDVDGDGFADVLVGAHGYDGAGTDLGRAYIFSGAATGVDTTPTTVLNPPENQDGQLFGFPVAGVGDVDGDGFADVLIGERGYDSTEMNAGRAHLFAGTATGVSSRAARTFSDPTPVAESDMGWGLGGVGDINGDYFADLVVGARRRNMVGAAFVYFGSSSGPPSMPDAILLAPEMQMTARFGFSIGGIGDVNGDGIRDLLVGARLFDRSTSNEGQAYLYYGTTDPFPTAPDLIINASPEQSSQQYGYSLDSAGDVNGDGIHDVVVGAPLHDETATNEGVLFFYTGAGGGLGTTPTRLAAGSADARLGIGVATVPSW